MEPAPSHILRIAGRPIGRQLAIGDIHGCLRTLRILLEEVVVLEKNDQLFPLGDYIHRGPSSSGVIDYLLTLQAQGYAVFPILGNHEQEFLRCHAEYCLEQGKPERLFRFCHLQHATDLLQANHWPVPRYLQFMESLPHAIALDHCYLVHAGFAKGPACFQSSSMISTRTPNAQRDDLGGRFAVHGHTPISLQAMREAIARRDDQVGIDNGCVFRYRRAPQGLGSLCAMDLHAWTLYSAPCADDIPHGHISARPQA